jgi:dephospho-CoA kinase
MIIAGLTGSIGTGKSTVAQMFADLGAYIIDADQLSREVVKPGKPAWQKIVDYFGKDVLNDDLTINRSRLADVVFNDKAKLEKLNSIVHPEVLKEDALLVEKIKTVNPDGLIVKEIPLLLELGPELARKIVDIIIVVYASPEVQLKRLIERGMSEEDARNRIKNQIPVDDKIKSADFVVNNNGDLESTRAQVFQIYNQLMGKNRG